LFGFSSVSTLPEAFFSRLQQPCRPGKVAGNEYLHIVSRQRPYQIGNNRGLCMGYTNLSRH
jgi:hypothetical protein